MTWEKEKYGHHGDGSGGSGQLDVFEMFFTQEAFDRFKLSPAEYEAVKTREEEEKKKKEGEKSKETKEQASPSPQPSSSPQASALAQASPSAQTSPIAQASASPHSSASPQSKEEAAKVEPVKIDLANIEYQTARLTLASSKLSDFLLTKDCEQLAYIANAAKG